MCSQLVVFAPVFSSVDPNSSCYALQFLICIKSLIMQKSDRKEIDAMKMLTSIREPA